MTIILIVFISIISLFGLLFILLLLPFKLRMDFSFVNNQFSGDMFFFWGSPLFISIVYSAAQKQPLFRIFGLQPGIWKRKFTKETPSDTEINEKTSVVKTEAPVDQENSIPEKTESCNNNSGYIKGDLKSEDSTTMTNEKTKPLNNTHKQKAENIPEKKAVEKKEKRKENVISRVRNNKIFVFLGNRNWRRKIINLIVRTAKSLLQILSIDHMKIHARAGLQDPALLGSIYAVFISVVNGLCLQNRKVELSFQPVFMQELFEMNGSINVRSSPANLIYPIIVTLINFPYLSTFLLWRKTKRSGKGSDIGNVKNS